MKPGIPLLSPSRIRRLRAQGYAHQTKDELSALAFGNRFAYRLCTTFLILGVALANVPVLTAMMTIAFFSIILPNHVFDYVYNNFLSHRMNRPEVPPRSRQLKFACIVATLWLGMTIYLFLSGLMTAGYIMGASLASVALLVSTTDFCIPSFIYNLIFNNK